MATTYKLIVKTGISPQEYLTENSRWYHDSDAGKNSSGITEITYTTRIHQLASITTVPLLLGENQDFIYLKNLSESVDDLLISLDEGTNYYNLLSPGECFSSKILHATTRLIGTTACYVKSLGKSNIEYFMVS